VKRQIQFGTERGIVSKEAVKQIRMLITDLSRTVQILDSDIRATEKRPRADLEITEILDTRRHNLLVTLASLEDHLGSVEKLRSRRYGVSSALHAAQAVPTRHKASSRSA
jgi:hypothetical protein